MKKQYWILIGSIILIVGLSIAVYSNMTPAELKNIPEYTPNMWDTIFDFLRLWAPIFAPSITLVGILIALFVGLRTLQQTHDIADKDRKERLRTEIVQWACDVPEFCMYLMGINATVNSTPEMSDEAYLSKITELGTRYERLRMKGALINKTAWADFQETLYEYTNKALKLLMESIDNVLKNLTARNPIFDETTRDEIKRKLTVEEITELSKRDEEWRIDSFLLGKVMGNIERAAIDIVEKAPDVKI